MSGRLPWRMRAYYAHDVDLPKRPGELAIEVGAATREALRMDVEAANRRADIGAVEVVELSS